MTVKTYRIEKNMFLKKVAIAVGDQMTLEEAERFEKEFKSTVTSIDASTYTLEVDCMNMKVLTKDLADKLTSAMELYKKVGFNKVVFTIDNNQTLKLQLSRIARTVGLTTASVIVK